MTVFVKHAVKTAKGKIYAPGKWDCSKAAYEVPVEQRTDYMVYVLCSSYDGHVRGGIRKTWRVHKDGLTLEQSKAILAKKAAA